MNWNAGLLNEFPGAATRILATRMKVQVGEMFRTLSEPGTVAVPGNLPARDAGVATPASGRVARATSVRTFFGPVPIKRKVDFED